MIPSLNLPPHPLSAGNLTILSSHSIVSQPYPVQYGVRTTASTSLQIECTTCDVGAPTEHCFKDLGVCVVLSNTAVAVIGMDGFLQGAPQPLDPMCTPRYLQMVHVNMIEMVVVCHDSRFHLVTRSGSAFELDSIEWGTGQGGIVVRDSYHGYPSLFLVELNGNHIDERNLFAGLPSVEITPHNNCTEYLSLYPLNTDGRFLLWCNTTAGGRVFVLNRLNREDAPSVELDSPPISSPDGRTFAATTGSILKLYRSDNLGQYPGVKDFGPDIILCTYLNSTTVLIVLDGHSQTVVNVETFIDTVGAEGLATLPYTSSRSRVHKLITQEVYATSNKTGALYNMLLFDITSSQALGPVSSLFEEPVNIFFQRSTAPDPPPTPDLPPTSQLSSTADRTIASTPTPTQVTRTSYTSALHSSLSVQSPTPTKDDPTKDPAKQELKNIFFLAGALVFAIVVFAIVLCFSAYGYRMKIRKYSWSKKTRPFSHGPIGQETNPEKGVSSVMLPSALRQDDDSSSPSNNSIIKSFVSIAPNATISRSNSGDLPFPQSIQETRVV